jgi:AraC-like DNA-binding protein
MRGDVLEELLTTLDVRLHAFAVCEVQRGWRLEFEAMDAAVVHYVLAGGGVLHQQEAAPVGFGPHSILVVAPGRRQSLLGTGEPAVTAVAAGESCLLLADGLIKFDAHDHAGDLVTVCGTITATHGGGHGLFDQLVEPLVEDVSGSPAFRGAFELLLQELSMPAVGTRALTEALMKQCLVLLLRNQLARYGENTPLFAGLREPRLARAVSVVLARPGAPHSLKSLAAEAGMSRSVFSERFLAAYAQSPFEFVQIARLRYAARLLSVSDLPVKSIAAAVGYASRSHFSRAFRSAFGRDPTAYRRRRLPDDELPAPMVRIPEAVSEAHF